MDCGVTDKFDAERTRVHHEDFQCISILLSSALVVSNPIVTPHPFFFAVLEHATSADEKSLRRTTHKRKLKRLTELRKTADIAAVICV